MSFGSGLWENDVKEIVLFPNDGRFFFLWFPTQKSFIVQQGQEILNWISMQKPI